MDLSPHPLLPVQELLFAEEELSIIATRDSCAHGTKTRSFSSSMAQSVWVICRQARQGGLRRRIYQTTAACASHRESSAKNRAIR